MENEIPLEMKFSVNIEIIHTINKLLSLNSYCQTPTGIYYTYTDTRKQYVCTHTHIAFYINHGQVGNYALKPYCIFLCVFFSSLLLFTIYMCTDSCVSEQHLIKFLFFHVIAHRMLVW